MSYSELVHHTATSAKSRASDKVITWDAANNARPPLQIDMEGPTPCSYSPRNKPLYETNSPKHSFGRRTFVEKGEVNLFLKHFFKTLIKY